jgi:hypothetical protein
VETEQIVGCWEAPGRAGGGVQLADTSYVIVRGSIPLLWTQLPNIKYKPTTVIAPAELSAPVSDT